MFKAWILAYGESTYATNSLEFETVKNAELYAIDLLSRWYGADRYAILPLDNNKFKGFLSKDTVKDNCVFSDEVGL